MRLDRRLANLGYGSRREIAGFIDDGRVTRVDGRPVTRDDDIPHDEILFDHQPLDPPPPFTIVLHKPVGFTCSTSESGPLVYDLLPPRFARRNPVLAIAGRLDKDSSGLVILTDDGALLHRIISPKKKVWKTYEAVLARPLTGNEAELFAGGRLTLRGESTPCAPAVLDPLDPFRARIKLCEGRYHQVRRMFAATGNHVEALHRTQIGNFGLENLAPGEWRNVNEADLRLLHN